MFGLGTQELLVILVIVLVMFGGSKLPEIARSLGKSMNEFKKGINEGASETDKEKEKEKDEKR
jgi:sec-independent protein translocase protein TatA